MARRAAASVAARRAALRSRASHVAGGIALFVVSPVLLVGLIAIVAWFVVRR
jgi:hypothetical protein